MSPNTSKRRSTIKYLLFLALISLLLAGCAGLVSSEQPATMDWAMLSAGQTIGQTFVAKYDGLTGIYFYLSPQTTGTGEIRLHLRSGPQVAVDLAVSANKLSIDAVKGPGFYGFFVPAQAASNQKYFYAYLEVSGDGEVLVGKAVGDAYLNGALYQNGAPVDAQAAFQLSYSRRKALLGIGWEAVTWSGILAVAFFLFILPGWGLFSLVWPGWGGLTWPEKLGLSAGLSLALYPLLLVWTDLIGLHLGALYAWLPPLAGLGMILWRNRKRLNIQSFPHVRALMLPLADIVFIGLTALIFLTRFWAIRSIDAPLWADSVQHTVITQLILDNGGLFKSWLPYAQYNSLTIQFGFSAFAALFAWLTGLGSVKATLIVGQIINGLAVLVLYPLAVRIARGNRWAGIGAVLVAGLLMPMPAFYVNWGRYAQLTGQAVLPVAFWLVWEALASSLRPSPVQKSHEIGRRAAIGLSALALAGMLLNSLRLPYFYITFLLALMVGLGIPEWGFNWKIWVRKVGILFAVAVFAGLLFLPWVIRLVGSVIAGTEQIYIMGGSPIQAVLSDYRAWLNLFVFVPEPLVIVALVGLAWSLVRKRWMVAVMVLWVAILSAVIAGWLIHLPGANTVQTSAILIALYIPVGLVTGWIIAEFTGSGKGMLRQSLVAIAVLTVAIWGALGQRSTAMPNIYAYVTRPDLLAAEWIRENLPGNANFLVEEIIYHGQSILGSDAGWWIPLLGHRQNTMPPQYALSETPIQPGYTLRMIALEKNLEIIPPASAQGVSLLCREGITHIYIGQGQGQVALRAMSLGPQLFSPDEFLSSQDFSLLYHQDRVYVFALKDGVCP